MDFSSLQVKLNLVLPHLLGFLDDVEKKFVVNKNWEVRDQVKAVIGILKIEKGFSNQKVKISFIIEYHKVESNQKL